MLEGSDYWGIIEPGIEYGRLKRYVGEGCSQRGAAMVYSFSRVFFTCYVAGTGEADKPHAVPVPKELVFWWKRH